MALRITPPMAIVALAAAIALAVLGTTDTISGVLALWLSVPLLAAALWFAVLSGRNAALKRSESISKITAAVRQLAAGAATSDLELPAPSDPELWVLSDAVVSATERSRQDIAELRRLEAVRSQFLGNVSHELRTPIFTVQGYLETLLDGAADDPTVRDEFLRNAHRNVLRLNELLSDLIDISRIESGEMKLSLRYFDAAEFFGRIVDELQPRAALTGIALAYEIIGPTRKLLGDRDRLKQVLVNLVDNAIKYNREGGTVAVELEFDSRYGEVRVRDSGPGIAPQHIDRIFERFYRVDRDRSRAVGGSGLGLSIVKHIVEAHGSTISVESTPGVGTTFRFRLRR